jgi:hypothetical protein
MGEGDALMTVMPSEPLGLSPMIDDRNMMGLPLENQAAIPSSALSTGGYENSSPADAYAMSPARGRDVGHRLHRPAHQGSRRRDSGRARAAGSGGLQRQVVATSDGAVGV